MHRCPKCGHCEEKPQSDEYGYEGHDAAMELDDEAMVMDQALAELEGELDEGLARRLPTAGKPAAISLEIIAGGPKKRRDDDEDDEVV